MATDQETAQRILGINNALQAGEIDQQTANELAAEDQVVLPMVEQTVPEALQVSSAGAPMAQYQQFEPTSEMVDAAKMAQKLQPNNTPAIWNYEPQSSSTMGKVGEYIGKYGVAPAVEGASAIAGMGQSVVQGAKDAGQGLIQGAAPEMAARLAQEQAAQEQAAQEAQAALASKAISEPAVALGTLEPTVQQQAKAVEEIVKPAQEAVAEHRATQMAQTELQAAMIKEQERLAAREKEIQDEISRQDTSVRFQSLPEILQGNSFENKLGAALALFAGAVSQGLTGAKSNPVMDFIDRQVALQADKDKLTADGKLALKKQLIDIGNMKLENLKARSQDQYQQQMIAAKQQEMLNERQKIEGDQRLKAQELFGKSEAKSALAAAYRGEAIDPQLAQNMNETEQKSIVQARGKTYKAINPSAAQKFQDTKASVDNAMAQLKPYQALVEKGLLRTLGEKGVMAALKDRGAAETMKTAIIGALRLPYTGPGALSDTERKALESAVSEFGVFNLPPVQAAKIRFIISDLKGHVQRAADDAGIKTQMWPETFLKVQGADGKERFVAKPIYFEQEAGRLGISVDEFERRYENLKKAKELNGKK